MEQLISVEQEQKQALSEIFPKMHFVEEGVFFLLKCFPAKTFPQLQISWFRETLEKTFTF